MAGTLTRKDLRLNLRQDLAMWPIPCTLAAAAQARQTQVQLADDTFKNFVEGKMLLEIDQEILRVIDIPEEGQTLRVIRGYMGTIPADHAKGATVNILPSWGWTDYELNTRILPQAVAFLHPFAWVDAVSATFVWSAGNLECAAPAGVAYPEGDHAYRLEVQNADGTWLVFDGWHLYGSVFRFNCVANVAHNLRARVVTFQKVLADDVTPLDNDRFLEPIVKYGAHLCFNALKTNRVRYYEYAAALNDRASTPDELVRTAFDLKNQAIVSREEKGMPKPSVFGSTYRERT